MTRKNSAVFADPAHSEPRNCLSQSKLPSMTRGEESADNPFCRVHLRGNSLGVHQKQRREMPGALCTQQPGPATRQLHFQGQPDGRIASNNLPSALPLPSLIPGSAIPQLGNQIFNFSIYITPCNKIYMSPWGLIGRVNIFNFLEVLEPGNPKPGCHKNWFLLKPHLNFLTDISFPHLLF